jgi:hypothetical protein
MLLVKDLMDLQTITTTITITITKLFQETILIKDHLEKYYYKVKNKL